jgi:glycerate kinase
VVESAQAVGLALVPPPARDLFVLRSWGVGELVEHALALGARTVWLALGDTGVVDGGAGLLAVLPRMPEGTTLVGLVDVDAPLAGPAGARRFMAQKAARGALSDVELDALERELLALHPRFALTPGAGAAGGLGAAVLALGGALRSGAEAVADAVGLDERVARADLVVTGEGRLDEQTLQGKAIAVLAALCRKHAKPLAVVCGTCALSEDALRAHGVVRAAPLVRSGVALADALADPAAQIATVTRDVVAELHRGLRPTRAGSTIP